MDKNKINLYISSKNKKPNESNNDFRVEIPSGLLACHPENEYMIMNINSWIMINNFYNIQSINNKFQIKYEQITANFELPIGNMNVLELNNWLNTNCGAFMTFEYNKNLNKLLFKNNVLNKDIIIKSITANDFIGLINNKEYSITAGQQMLSENPLWLGGDEFVCLMLPDIKQSYPCIDNLKSGVMKDSSIVATLAIDTPPFSFMKYENQDGGDSFSYRIENKMIDNLRLIVKNQNLEDIQVGDYKLEIQFEIHSKNSIIYYLKKIERLVSNIFQYLGRKENL